MGAQPDHEESVINVLKDLYTAGTDFMRGINLDYEDQNAIGVEAGFRWMVWKGLNLRIGAIALMARDHDVEINPTPGISYSFFIR